MYNDEKLKGGLIKLKKHLLSVLIFIAILLAGNCVFGFTIVLDPGHGGTEPGAIAQNEELEKDLARVEEWLSKSQEKEGKRNDHWPPCFL